MHSINLIRNEILKEAINRPVDHMAELVEEEKVIRIRIKDVDLIREYDVITVSSSERWGVFTSSQIIKAIDFFWELVDK